MSSFSSVGNNRSCYALHMIHGERHFPLTKDTWHPIRGEKDLLKDFNSLLIAYIDIINVAILPTDESK